jgi:hypothetical protein
VSEVACQKCGTVVSHREALFFGPPHDVTWLCNKCAGEYKPAFGAFSGSQRAPIAQTSRAELVEAVKVDAVDLHRLRFELAHIIRYFDEHKLPEELTGWYQTVKKLLRNTNTGKPWTVEE